MCTMKKKSPVILPDNFYKNKIIMYSFVTFGHFPHLKIAFENVTFNEKNYFTV